MVGILCMKSDVQLCQYILKVDIIFNFKTYYKLQNYNNYDIMVSGILFIQLSDELDSRTINYKNN